MRRTAISTILLLVWWCATSFAQPVTSGPDSGTLIIIGGAARDTVFINTFMRLAGGPDAPIVVIPTAQERPGGADGDLARPHREAMGQESLDPFHGYPPTDARSPRATG